MEGKSNEYSELRGVDRLHNVYFCTGIERNELDDWPVNEPLRVWPTKEHVSRGVNCLAHQGNVSESTILSIGV